MREARVCSRSWMGALMILAGLSLAPLLAWVLVGDAAGPFGRPSTESAAPSDSPPEGTSSSAREGASQDEPAAPGRVVSGLVTGPGDEPVAGAELAVVGHPKLRTNSRRDGRYRLPNVPLAEVRLVVTARGYQRAQLPVPEDSAGAHQIVDVQLHPGLPVSGLVVDFDGRPIAGASVRCRQDASEGEPLTATSAPDGRFELGPTAADCVAIAGHPLHGESEPVTLRPHGRNLLHLPGGAAIEGVVVDESGQPVARYLLGTDSFRPRGDVVFGRGTRRRIEVNDSSGAFVLDRLAPGEYVLVALVADRPPAHSATIELDAGERERNVRIVVTKGGVLRGRVHDGSTGRPIAGARIALDSATTTPFGSLPATRSDDEGRYRLDGMPAEPFSVRVWAEGYRAQVRSGLVTDGSGQLELPIALEPRGEEPAGATEYTGIGAVVGPGAEGVAIIGLVEGGPAEQAGVRKGDVVLRIDGVDVRSWSLAQCVQRLRGPAGSRVTVTLERDDGPRFELVITRGSFRR